MSAVQSSSAVPSTITTIAPETLAYASDGKRTMTKLDFVALACLPTLALAVLWMPRLFSGFRGLTWFGILLAVAIVAIAGVLPLVAGIIGVRRARRRCLGIETIAWIALLGGAVNLLSTPVISHVTTE